MMEILRHRQPKGSATDRLHLNHRATSLLYRRNLFSPLFFAEPRLAKISPDLVIHHLRLVGFTRMLDRTS